MDTSKNVVQPYDDAAKTILAKIKRLIIPVINELFGTSYTMQAVVELMYTELKRPHGHVVSLNLDSHFRISENGESTEFHLEVESAPKRSIVMRFWDYDSLTASFEQDENDKWTLRVTMPKAGLIVLRPLAGKPSDLSLVFSGDDGEAKHKINVLYLDDYDAEKLINKELTFLMPFLLFCFAKQLDDARAAGEQVPDDLSKKVESELLRTAVYYQQLVAEKKLTEDEIALLAEMTKYVSNSLAGDLPDIRKAVDETMGGRILETPYEMLQQKARDAQRKAKKMQKQAKKARKKRVASTIETARDFHADDAYIVERLEKTLQMSKDEAVAAIAKYDAHANA